MKIITGFTLLEILVVLSIISIGLLLVVPTWHVLIAHNRATTAVNHFATLIELARDEAIKRHQTVSLCSSSDQKTCSGIWADGQLVFVDAAKQGVPTLAAIIYSNNRPQTSGHWRLQAFGEKRFLSLLPLGVSAQSNASFIYCPNDNDVHFAHAIFISKTGRVRLSQDADHDGIDEDAENNPLRCQ